MISLPIWLFVIMIIFGVIGLLLIVAIVTTLIMGALSSIDYTKQEEIDCPYFLEGKDNE